MFLSHFRRRGSILPCLIALSVFLPEREACALVPFMDGGIYLHLEAVGTYDSNLFANANEQDDLYLTLVPELQYTRATGTVSMDLRAGIEVLRFVDFSDQDAENLFSSLAFEAGQRPRQAALEIDWRETSATREDVGARTRSEILNASLSGRSQVSDRLALRGLGSYGNEEFREGAFSEIDTWVLGVDGLHIYSEHLETFLGYRYRKTETAGITRRSLSIDDHLLHIGAEGQLSARTVGFVSVGVQNRSFDDPDLSDKVRPYGTISGTWTPRARSEITLLGSKDFSVTPDDRSVDRTSIRLVLNQGVYRGFSLEPVVSYTQSRVDRPDGRSRQDDRYEAGIGFIYDLASGASTALRYSYRNQDSDNAFFDYQRHTIDLSAGIRF